MDYFRLVCRNESKRLKTARASASASGSAPSCARVLQALNVVVAPLFELSQEMPDFAAAHARLQLNSIHTKLNARVQAAVKVCDYHSAKKLVCDSFMLTNHFGGIWCRRMCPSVWRRMS